MAYSRERLATGAEVVWTTINGSVSDRHAEEDIESPHRLSVQEVLLEGPSRNSYAPQTRLTLRRAQEILGVTGEGSAALTRILLEQVEFLSPVLLYPEDKRPVAWEIDEDTISQLNRVQEARK